MKKLFVCMLWPVMAASAQETSEGKMLLNRFREYITGDFDNSRQVMAEMKAGKIIHPLAIHVNRVADDKVINQPTDLNGFFILEESYYLTSGKRWKLSPTFFYSPLSRMESFTSLLSN
jgi:hypothetical protein